MFYIVFAIITFCLLIFLGFYVLLSNYRSKINIIFFLIILASLEWLITNFAIDYPKDLTFALVLAKLTLIGPLVIAPLYYAFSKIFSIGNKRLNYIDKIFVYILPLILLIFTPTKWNVENVWIEPWGINFQPGLLYYFVLIYFIVYLILSLRNFYKGYLKNKGLKKRQNLLILFGFTGALLVGMITNLIFPIIGFNNLITIGPYLAVLTLVTFTFFSVMKYQMFNIKVLASKFFSFFIVIILFAEILISKSKEEIILKTILLIIVICFAYLLVKSVMKEVNQKKIIMKLNTELKQKNLYLDELLKMKSEFLHITSHQLKTPISIIKGYLSMILDGSYKGNKKTEAIKKSLINVDRLNDTVKDFLDASDLGGESVYLKKGAVDIVEEIREIVTAKELLAKYKNIKLEITEPKQKLPLVFTSTDKIEDVFSNLIDNAIYYSPKGTVSISFDLKNNYLTVKVADQGIGIEKEEAKKLFVKFSRGNRAKLLRPDGSGLGLFIIKQILDNTGGKIWLESEGHDKGTTFFVQLPIFKK